MATHSSNLAWEITWIEEPSGLLIMTFHSVQNQRKIVVVDIKDLKKL